MQDNQIVHSLPSTILGPDKYTDSIMDFSSDNKKNMSGNGKDFQENSRMVGMSDSLEHGHIITVFLWNDVEVDILWFDATYSLNKPKIDTGIKPGDCLDKETSTPTYLHQTYCTSGVFSRMLQWKRLNLRTHYLHSIF